MFFYDWNEIGFFSPQVTYPTPITMQVDFPSRHSNVIIDNGRTSTNLISSYDTTHRTPPRVSKETSSTEYTSTRKIGGDGGGSSSFIRSSSKRNFFHSSRFIKYIISGPRTYSPYDDLYGGTNLGRNNTYSSTNQYQTIGNQSPLRRDYTNSTTGSYNTSTNPTYTYRVTASDAQPRTIYPSSSSHGESGTVQEKTYSESRRETQHRRSSPTSGVQSSREFEHHRSGSPSLGRSLDDDHFRSNLTLGRPGMTTPASSRNVEVHEFSRRVGTNGNDNNNFIPREPLLFSQGFNSDAFYRSAFQPQVSTDNNGQKRIEMKLDVKNYQPNEVKVSVNGNDLIVQAEHNVDQPPTSSSRAYFYKQITLPPNTDISSLASQYHPDGRLHITASLSPEQPYIRYN
jgi:HSP20 family molecular chaperone IbpA